MPDTPSSPPQVAPDGGEFTTATEAVQAIPTSKADIVRFSIGYALLGFLWLGGLLVVTAVILPQALTNAKIPHPEGIVAAFNAIGTVFALVSNIVWGVLSDRTRSRFGRRAPWMITGSVLAGFTLWLTGATTNPVIVIVAFCLAQIFLNMLLAPAVAVMADRVPHKMRGVVSASYGTGLTVGIQVGILVGAALILKIPVGFIAGAVALGISGIIAVLIWPRDISTKDLPAPHQDFKSVVRALKPPTKAPDFYWAFTSRFFMLISYQMITAFQLYIVQKYIGQSTVESAATLATMAIIALIVSLIGSVISGPISDLLKRRKLPVIIAALLFAAGIAAPWIWPTSMGMFLFAGLAGFGYGVYTSVDQALLVDVLPNQEDAGKDMAILNMSTTAGSTLGPIISSVIVSMTGAYLLIFPVAIVMALCGAFSVGRIKHVR
jgi:MFS family permease